MAAPSFTKKVIGELNNADACTMNTLFNVADVNGDGWPDIVASGRSGQMAWFQNPGLTGEWTRHVVAHVENKECGGLGYSLTGRRDLDLVNGGDYRSNELCWWENSGGRELNEEWVRRVIFTAPGTQFHDELIGDVTGDGRQSLVFWNQGCQTLYCAPLPPDPRVTPWPDVRIIAAGKNVGGQPEEGLALVDLDGDGQNEIVAGTRWYSFAGGAWEEHVFAEDYITTVIATGDIDGDGRPEIVLSEGDACIYSKPQGGKVAWFKPGGDIRDPWEEHLIDEHLLDPHSLQLGDLCGTGRQDLLVGEIGVKERYLEDPPRLMVYENDGHGNFTRHVIDRGTGTHHARLCDFRQKGVLDIASRPLHGEDRWKIYVWFNDRTPQ